MKAQNRIAIAVACLAIVALVFQEKLWDYFSAFRRSNDPRPVVASLNQIVNTVRYRYPDSLTWRKVTDQIELRDSDAVTTDADSSAVLAFKTGLSVELEPNSLIIVHNYGGTADSLELTFLKGRVKILSQPAARPRVEVPVERLPKPVKITALPSLPQVALPAPSVAAPEKVALEEKEETKPPLPPSKVKREAKETLPDSYIAMMIRNQRQLLNRCYAQHLRLNPDTRGRIDTSLTIDPDGTISSARVIGSTISDPALQQCVVTALQRAKFRAYNGDPIIVNYPINFE